MYFDNYNIVLKPNWLLKLIYFHKKKYKNWKYIQKLNDVYSIRKKCD